MAVEPAQRIDQRIDVARSGPTPARIGQHVAARDRLRRDGWKTAGERLEQREAETLEERWKYEHVGGLQPRAQRGGRLRRKPRRARGQRTLVVGKLPRAHELQL